MNMLALIVGAVAAGYAAPAAASECKGVTFSDTVEVGGQTLILNGLGLREATIFRIDVYVAGLYLDANATSGEDILASPGAKHLSLVFLRNVSRRNVTDAWSEGFRKTSAARMPALQPHVDTLNRWMEAVNQGDNVEFTYVPGPGTEVSIRGKKKGSIPGAEFGEALFAIWLGPDPPNESLKAGLLGGACG